MKNNSIAKVCLVLAYIEFVSLSLLNELKISGVLCKAVGLLCVVLSLLSFLTSLHRRRGKELLLVIGLLVMSVFVQISFNDSTIVYLLVLSLGARKIQKKLIVKTDLCLKIAFFVVIFSLYLLGIINVQNFERLGEARNSLGFHHPNYAGLIALNIFLDIIYLRKDKLLSNIIIGIPFFILLNSIINSRSAAVGLILSIVAQFITIPKITSSRKRVIIALFSVGIFAVISFAFLMIPLSGGIAKLDVFLSGRIKYAKAFYDYYGIRLFGNVFEIFGKKGHGDQFYVLDNAYLYLAIHYGIIIFATFITFYSYKIYCSIKNKDNKLFRILFVYAIIGLMEMALFQPSKNPFMLLSEEDRKKEVRK